MGGLISGFTTYKQTGSLKKAFIAGAVGAVNGAIAATGWHFLLQAGISVFASGVGDLAMQMIGEDKAVSDINWGRAGYNAALGGALSVVGSGFGSLASYGQASIGKELVSAASDKLLTGYIRQSVGQSSSALIRQGQKLFAQGMRYVNTGRGISSVTGSILTWAPSVEFSMP